MSDLLLIAATGRELRPIEGAELAGVPAIEVRVISNSPVDVDRSLWRTEDALEVLHATVRALVPALRESLA